MACEQCARWRRWPGEDPPSDPDMDYGVWSGRSVEVLTWGPKSGINPAHLNWWREQEASEPQLEWSRADSDGWDLNDVACWMPLPEPPAPEELG